MNEYGRINCRIVAFYAVFLQRAVNSKPTGKTRGYLKLQRAGRYKMFKQKRPINHNNCRTTGKYSRGTAGTLRFQ